MFIEMSSRKSPVQKYTEIDVFYDYNKLKTKKVKTKKAKKMYKILYAWKNNLHPQYYATMNYKLITDFIILYKMYYRKKTCRIQYKKDLSDEFTDSILPLYMDVCKKKIGYGDCLEPIISMIIELSNAITNTPTFAEIYPKNLTNKTLTLYRGFQYDRYGGFFKLIDNPNIKIGDTITTPVFLSTTLIQKVATLFTRSSVNEKDSCSKRTIMWKITIPHHLLLHFQYTYLGNNININKIDWNKLNFNNIDGDFDKMFISKFETEILLNLGASLKCLSITKEKLDDNLLGKMKYTLYHFEFLGYNTLYQQQFLTGIKEFKRCLSINYKTKGDLSYCKNPKRLLNCSVI
jgi:hypothetical protein